MLRIVYIIIDINFQSVCNIVFILNKDYAKNVKGKGNLLPKNEEISGGKAHTNTRIIIQNILTITDVFLNQKIVNVCDGSSFPSYLTTSLVAL